LRAVQPGETKARPSRAKKKLDVAQAAASGDQRQLLEAMRDRIAVTVTDPHCPPRDLASLTKRLADIAEQLKALELQEAEEVHADGPTPDEAWNEEAL
jgi:hypothetical protein